MEDFIFHEGIIPEGYQPHVDCALFNQQKFLQLQSERGWHSYYVLDRRHKFIQAAIHFYIEANVASSLWRSPFGSFEFSKDLPAEILYGFIEFIETRLRALKISRVFIKNPPDLYQPQNAIVIQVFLLNQGFQIESAEISSIIPVSNNSFEELIHVRKRRKLKQKQNEALKFYLLPHKHLAEVYQFIESCRDEKHFKLSVSLEHLAKTIARFENEYILFGVFYNEKLVAASITVKVSNQVLYHFMSDYVRKVENVRPGLVLMQGIYDYCQTQKITLLDLGTSVKDFKPNFNLLNYKKELGAVQTAKFTFVKDLS